MRCTLRDVAKHPSGLASWWIDLPMRRRAWWSMALMEPGTGWLRWGRDDRSRIYYDPPDMDQWTVTPPLRRAWDQIHWALLIPRLMIREHLTWDEAGPAWECLRADPERKKDLWR
jgi:hypothetical protein